MWNKGAWKRAVRAMPGATRLIPLCRFAKGTDARYASLSRLADDRLSFTVAASADGFDLLLEVPRHPATPIHARDERLLAPKPALEGVTKLRSRGAVPGVGHDRRDRSG